MEGEKTSVLAAVRAPGKAELAACVHTSSGSWLSAHSLWAQSLPPRLPCPCLGLGAFPSPTPASSPPVSWKTGRKRRKSFQSLCLSACTLCPFPFSPPPSSSMSERRDQMHLYLCRQVNQQIMGHREPEGPWWVVYECVCACAVCVF